MIRFNKDRKGNLLNRIIIRKLNSLILFNKIVLVNLNIKRDLLFRGLFNLLVRFAHLIKLKAHNFMRKIKKMLIVTQRNLRLKETSTFLEKIPQVKIGRGYFDYTTTN